MFIVDEFDEKGRVRRKEVVFDTDEGAACRHIARRLGEAEARVSREGNGDGGKFVADVGRSGGGGRDVGRQSERARH